MSDLVDVDFEKVDLPMKREKAATVSLAVFDVSGFSWVPEALSLSGRDNV